MRSLIIQASIHAIMLGIPNMMFVYAFLFGYKNEIEPALHAPHTLMRTTGILSRAGVGSLVQTYMLSLGLEYNALTISEMFWFRYKLSSPLLPVFSHITMVSAFNKSTNPAY
ncbi:hypothetical protein L5515_006182 [Caenorhabditis briggsae]|uniref:Uncharacterized protein n=1 Tax=Caenorhabditis briggsae TaxID=6238 RepID=A0AAE9F1C6_CAEBR|nr:hypothetical protein L5515_006182 [Caenorhabditis briggsae]